MINKIHSTIDNQRQNHLADAIKYFFAELDLICEQNDVSDLQHWFTERTFLSLYINGHIRNKTNAIVSAIQEYAVHNKDTKLNGRCDAMMTINRTLFLLESKRGEISRKIDPSHWNIQEWSKFDETIFVQLNKRYFEPEEPFYLDEKRYDEVFLQTVVFKIIENSKDRHFSDAECMDIKGEMLNGRGWYYGCHYPPALQSGDSERIGVEIYGSILRRR